MLAPFRRWMHAPRELSSGAAALERGHVGALMSVTVAGTVLVLGVLLPIDRSFEVSWAVVALVLGGSSHLSPLRPMWERIGGVTAIAMIALLVWGTGGLDSRYHLLYVVNGVFGVAYHSPRRRLAEAAATLVGLIAPLSYDTAVGAARVGRIVIIGVVYATVVAFLSWVADRLRATERSRATTQSRYESAFQGSPLPIVTLDADDRIETVNPAFLEWAGYPLDEVGGAAFLRFVASEDIENARSAIEDARRGQARVDEWQLVDAFGRRRDVLMTTLPLDHPGGGAGTWALLRDVTGEPTALETLRASEERYRRLVQHLPVVIYHAPPAYFRGEEPLWYISPNVEAWLGYPVGAWLSDAAMAQRVVHPDDRERVLGAGTVAQRSEGSRRIEYRVLAADGAEYWVLDQAHPVPGPEDQAGWVQGVLLDITSDKHAQFEIAQRTNVQQTLSDYARAALHAEDFDALADHALDAATRLSGSSAASLYLRSGDALELIHSRGWDRAEPPPIIPIASSAAIGAALRGEHGEFEDIGVLAQAGFSAGLGVPVGRSGGPVGVLVVADTEARDYSELERDALMILAGFIGDELERDATLQRLDEGTERAAAQARRSAALIDLSPLPTLELRPDATVVHANAATERVLGVTSQHRGQRLPDLVPELTTPLAQLMRAVRSGQPAAATEVTAEIPARGERVVQLHAGPSSVADGEGNVVVFLLDVTERRELERHLAQVDKMEALGRLAGGIAHDVNNLLSVIRSYADLAMTGADPVTVREDLEGLIRATDEGAALVASFLGLARHEEEEEDERTVRVDEVIAAEVGLVRQVLPEHVTVDIETQGGHPPLRVAEQHLRRMLLDLVSNAADAYAGVPGTVHVRVTSTDATVTVAVRDDGVGMDEATEARAIEPFFTTKSGAGGTGLGLYTVYGLARRYGARVDIDSAPGEGTEVSIVFPILAPTAPVAQRRGGEPRAAPTEPQLSILVVEDEPRVRALTGRILVEEGHSVRSVDSAEAAIETLAEEEFDVLVSDVLLPGMDGIALADLARRVQPTMAVVLMSGHAADPRLREGMRVGDLDLLAKPFERRALLLRIQDAVTRAAALTES